MVESKAVTESTSAIPEHAAEDSLEHFVEFEIIDGLCRNGGVEQCTTASIDVLQTLE